MEIDKPMSAEIEDVTPTNIIDLTVGPSSIQLSSNMATGHLNSNVIDLTSEPGSEDSLFMTEQPFSQFDAEDTVTINEGYDYESDASSDPYIGGYTDSEDEIASGRASTGEVPTSPIKTSPISDRKGASINSYCLKYPPLCVTESDSEVEWNGNTTTSVHSDGDSVSDLGDADIVVENSCNKDERDDQSTDASSDHDYSTSDEIDEEDEEDSGSELSRDLNNVPYWDEELSSSYSKEEDDADGLDTFGAHPMPLVDVTSTSGSSLPVPTVSSVLPTSSQFNAISPRTICGTPAYTRGPTAPFIPVRPLQSIISNSVPGHVNQPSHLPTQKDRQPSPSDAVMAKIIPMQHVTSSAAQSLGERTGKYEFFAARDHNRASVMSNPLIPKIPSPLNTNTTPIVVAKEPSMTDTNKVAGATAASTNAVPQTGNLSFTEHFENSLSDKNDANDATAAQVRSPCPPWREPQLAKDAMTDIILESRYGVDQPPLVNSTWTHVGEAFLKEPDHCLVPVSDERTRLQSPELDMTSAATFAESKKKTEADASRSRSRLAVKFLLHESKETSPTPASGSNDSPRPPKRSYDEVFAESEEQHIAEDPSNNAETPVAETDAITTGMSGTDTPMPDNTVLAVASSENIISDTPELAPTDSEVIIALAEQLDTRPAKRRRLSKFAKYASVSIVSGFTSAALVFAGLAATAPQIV
ncbi:hypothetical protein TruAng_002889 [Truncatella angustata]|nr:hypothetical protein TruAng_002889 [Truncatella angustata]